jgi:hypothetical protein
MCACRVRTDNVEIVDRVAVPSNLPAGEWVLNWRMDQEESNQIWQSCADIAVVAPEGTVEEA